MSGCRVVVLQGVKAGQASTSHSYRPDIDGLRALAILPILLLHCGVSQLRGGFVGVDVFFVLSGYLITAILIRDIDQGSYSLARFYRHRIVRILPALLVMMIVTLAVGSVMLLPNALRQLGESFAATSVFGSNIYFYFTSDYFAAASDAKPLIHSWSLAVEEQFYLAYPPLLWALRGLGRRKLIAVIGSIAGVSFLVGAWLAHAAPSAGFFLLPARIWELALGALVALGAAPVIAREGVRRALCIAALLVLIASVVVTGPGWPFPVPFALPPVVATAVLIAYGQTAPSARLLSIYPLRFIGLLSYSAYLWHRPIIAFYEVRFGSDFKLADTLILLLATFVAAWLSYVLVEKPTRARWRNGSGRWPHWCAGGVILLCVGAGLWVAAQADRIRALPPEQAQIARYQGWDATPQGRLQFSTNRCFQLPNGTPFDPDCLTLSADKPNVLLMGNSHAAHFSQALRDVLPGAHVVQATAAGCRPVIGASGIKSCLAVMDQGFAAIATGKIDTVVLSAIWVDYEEAELLATLQMLTARGQRVIVVGPSAEFLSDLPVILIAAQQWGDPGLVARLQNRDRQVTDRKLAVKVPATGAIYVSAMQAQCPNGVCNLVTNAGDPYQFDRSHMTPAAARWMIERVANAHLSALTKSSEQR